MSNEAVRAGRRVWKIVLIAILVSAAIRLTVKLVQTIAGRDSSD